MILRLAGSTLALALMLGCASLEELELGYDAQVEIASVPTAPTITIECTQGCKASYIDPRDRIKIPSVTNSNDALVKIAPSIITGVGYVAGAVAITRVVDDFASSAGGGNTTTHTTSVVSGDNNTTTGTTKINTEDSQVQETTLEQE